MVHFGRIENFDRERGLGTIIPESGGDALIFAKSALRPDQQTPQVNQRFSYEISQIYGSRKRAICLRAQGETVERRAQNRQLRRHHRAERAG